MAREEFSLQKLYGIVLTLHLQQDEHYRHWLLILHEVKVHNCNC